ncbi:MAG TPA: PrgI family protein [Candidatus Paceibacterota bacterium]
MQFKVPQFLEIEDKIFGPFTFKEFIYLAGGAGLCFILYKLLGLLWGAVPILVIAAFSFALTFYRPNNKPFIFMIESSLKYFSQSKLYIWKKQKASRKAGGAEKKEGGEISMMPADSLKLNGSKLRDLAWSLDVLDLSKQKDSNVQ